MEVYLLDGKSKRRASNTNIRIGAEELLPTSKNKVTNGAHLLSFQLICAKYITPTEVYIKQWKLQYMHRQVNKYDHNTAGAGTKTTK